MASHSIFKNCHCTINTFLSFFCWSVAVATKLSILLYCQIMLSILLYCQIMLWRQPWCLVYKRICNAGLFSTLKKSGYPFLLTLFTYLSTMLYIHNFMSHSSLPYEIRALGVTWLTLVCVWVWSMQFFPESKKKTDTLLNVFLAIAVDNLANAQELTKVLVYCHHNLVKCFGN